MIRKHGHVWRLAISRKKNLFIEITSYLILDCQVKHIECHYKFQKSNTDKQASWNIFVRSFVRSFIRPQEKSTSPLQPYKSSQDHCQPIKSYILWKLITPTITWPTDKVDKVDKDKVDKMYKDKGMRWMNGEGGQGRRDGQGGQG